MAPKKDLESVLFHQKKKPIKDQQKHPQSNGTPQRKSRPLPVPTHKEEDVDSLNLPDAPFTDFKIFSSALNGWKYDVMKFDSRKQIDISTWPTPIKLNRKDLRRDDGIVVTGPAVGPMLGPDGKPVVGADGRMVMVDADGRVVQENAAASSSKGKGSAPVKRKFQKKTRQVFLIPEETKQLRREERYPWVMEDATGNELWIAQLDDTTKSETQGFFMPAANDVFKFVPGHRWYRFQKKLKHALPTDTQNMESAYQQSQKRDPAKWFSRRVGRPMSESTQAMFKGETDGVDSGNSLVRSSGQSLGPGGRKLRTVDSGRNAFAEEEDQKRGERDPGEEGDMDEMLFDEEFADDDDKMEVDGEEEEAKELEERLKREYKQANKTREGYIDPSDDEDQPQMSKAEKRMQKLIRSREGNDAYESDEDKNPYASSEESSEDEEILPPTELPPATPSQSQSSQNGESQSQTQDTPSNSQQQPVSSDVRAISPGSPRLGGHSILAKRATSPKPSKPKANGSRAASPLASRATSPVPNQSRATSPAPQGGSRAGSPVNGKKRKAEDTNGSTSPTSTGPIINGVPKAKKRKAVLNGSAPGGELDDRMLIEWLKAMPNASTRDCIHHFTPYLTDDTKKAKFTALVKEVAVLKGGVLVLRSAYRGGSSAPSPAP